MEPHALIHASSDVCKV